MDLDYFSQKNLERCESSEGFNHKLESWSLSDWMTALIGEVGEAASIVKKLNRVRDEIRGNKETKTELMVSLQRELADVFIYLNLTMQRVGCNPTDLVKSVFNTKSDKLGCSIKV